MMNVLNLVLVLLDDMMRALTHQIKFGSQRINSTQKIYLMIQILKVWLFQTEKQLT